MQVLLQPTHAPLHVQPLTLAVFPVHVDEHVTALILANDCRLATVAIVVTIVPVRTASLNLCLTLVFFSSFISKS